MVNILLKKKEMKDRGKNVRKQIAFQIRFWADHGLLTEFKKKQSRSINMVLDEKI